jgi:hypothetical protein
VPRTLHCRLPLPLFAYTHTCAYLQAARHILAQVSQAYGLMILGEGLFQADGHPGNILVQRGGRVALLDYGQSKQLEEVDKVAFADLILAMNRCVVSCTISTGLRCGSLGAKKHKPGSRSLYSSAGLQNSAVLLLRLRPVHD